VIGGCRDALGQSAMGDAAFAESLGAARRRQADHQLTFTIAALAERARNAGTPIDLDLIREAIPIQRRLGVVIDLAGYEDEQSIAAGINESDAGQSIR
jgi:hypothetical protein